MPERALSTTSPDKPPLISQVMAFPVSRRPMFPGTMQAITINQPWVIESLQVRERDAAFPCAPAAVLPKTDAFACGAADARERWPHVRRRLL